LEKIEAFRARGAHVEFGAFGENIVAEGFDFAALPVGTLLSCGHVLLEITQIGKECHSHCEIFKVMGDCIMPREGVFARVLGGGVIRSGDVLLEARRYRAAIITASDKGSRGEREDTSAQAIREILAAHGYAVASYKILPDEQPLIEAELKRLADSDAADLILTTGGTGMSPRDRTPEATLAVAERLVPGIAEAMRAFSMTITKRAMLSRAVAALRKQSLIINLPGSKKAVEESLGFIIGELRHGLDTLNGSSGDCGRV
jgi:molybdenum cofactor synthesis domain-containing protein